jgi:hypothetical protein
MEKIPFKKYLLKRINICSIFSLTTAFLLIVILNWFINKEIKTAKMNN